MASARGFWASGEARASSAEPESALFMTMQETNQFLSASDDSVDLSEVISNLTFVRLMKDEKRIVPEDEAQVNRANDIALWKPLMEEYVSYVCSVNPNFPTDRQEELLQKSADYYREHLKVLMDDLAYDLDAWKVPFEGCLFI